MFFKASARNIEITIFTVFGLHLANSAMSLQLVFLEFFLTKLALIACVKLLLMLFLEIFIISFSTNLTFNDISAAIASMCSILACRDIFIAVLTVLTFLHDYTLSIKYFNEAMQANRTLVQQQRREEKNIRQTISFMG
jgi:hypothetical protein